MHAEIMWIFVGAVLLVRFWRTALFLCLCALAATFLIAAVTVADGLAHWFHLFPGA